MHISTEYGRARGGSVLGDPGLVSSYNNPNGIYYATLVFSCGKRD